MMHTYRCLCFTLFLAVSLLSACKANTEASATPPLPEPTSSSAEEHRQTSAQTISAKTQDITSAANASLVLPGDKLEPSVGDHQYYGVYVQGQKAGWAQQRVSTLADGGVELWMKVVVRLARGSKKTGLDLLHINRYAAGPKGRLQEVRLEQTLLGGATSVHHGVMEKNGFIMRVSSGGNTSETVIEAPREIAEDSIGSYLVPRLLKLGEGTSVVTHQFDPMTQKSIPIETVLMSQKQTYLSGDMVTVLDVQGTDRMRGLTMRTRFTAAGLSLEMVLGPGFKLLLEEKTLAQDQSQGVPDLYRLSRVPIDKPIMDATRTTRLILEVDGLSADVDITDARQSRDGKRLEIRRLGWDALPKEPLSEADRTRWLRTTPFVDHQSKSVQALLRSIRKSVGEERVRSLSSAVHQAISYTLATAPLSASQILAEAKGDCTEYSLALVALLRADGIPAREVSGLAYAGDGYGFAFHAWAEAYVDGRWVALDPTWNQYPIDATHIALSRDDPSPILGMLGGVSIRLIERR